MRIHTALRRGLLLTILLMLVTFVAGLGILLIQHASKKPPSVQPAVKHTFTIKHPHKTATSGVPADVPKRAPSIARNALGHQEHSATHAPDKTHTITRAQPRHQAPAKPKEVSDSPQIAIIIDDIGHQWAAGKRSANLKGDVTLAILPFSPYAQQLAALATTLNKEIILHAPMEPISHHSWNGGLSHDMTREQVKNTLRQMIAAVPGATGVNNHMGSALTQNSTIMSWVMETLAERNLYFIDSRTSALSRAQTAAHNHNIPNQKRDVFLDNTREIAAIERQVSKLIRLAKKNGTAIGIGHPYPETLTVLEQSMHAFTRQNIQLVPASKLLLTPPQYTINYPEGGKEFPPDAAVSATNNAHF